MTTIYTFKNKGINETQIINKDLLSLLGDVIKCQVCKKIVNNPLTCEKCEIISYCSHCILGNTELGNCSNVACLVCKEKKLRYFPEVLKIFLKNLKISCVNPNCKLEMKYDELNQHACYDNTEESGSKLIESDFDFCNSNKLVESVDVVFEGEKEEIKETEELNELEQKDASFANSNNFLFVDNLMNEENEFYKVSSNFMDSLYLDNIDKNLDNNCTDINSLNHRVANLEKLCASLIKELTQFKNLNQNPGAFISLPKGQNKILTSSNKKTNLHPVKCNQCSRLSYYIKLCDKCTKEHCENCILKCSKCDSYNCKKCSKCEICKKCNYCYNCKSCCNQCIRNNNAFCEGCIQKCEICLDNYCIKCCSFRCKDCEKLSCLKCTWSCKSCVGVFCKDYPNEICKQCGVTNCKKCFELCFVCKKEKCKNCTLDCNKCNQKICKGCCLKKLKNNTTFEVECKDCISKK